MAAPHSLQIGDVVTHPSWAAGTMRKVVGIRPFRHATRVNGRSRLVASKTERSVELDAPAHDASDKWVNGASCSAAEKALDRYWMEAGLVKVPQ